MELSAVSWLWLHTVLSHLDMYRQRHCSTPLEAAFPLCSTLEGVKVAQERRQQYGKMLMIDSVWKWLFLISQLMDSEQLHSGHWHNKKAQNKLKYFCLDMLILIIK